MMIGYKLIEEFTLAECEEYLKRQDISEEERQRAEKRKEELLQQPRKSILEEFPEYGFKPTSLMPGPATKTKSFGKASILIGGIALLVALVFFGLMANFLVKAARCEREADYYLEKAKEGECESVKKAEKEAQWKKDEQEDLKEIAAIMGGIGGGLTYIGVIILVSGLTYRKKGMPIKAVADYVSSSRKGKNKGMVIFVKDRRFGVLKGFNIVIVPAEYDKLTWQSKKFLFGEIDGKVLLVDTKGNRCTKPYDHLSWSEHKDVLRAELDGRSFLIDIHDNVLS